MYYIEANVGSKTKKAERVDCRAIEFNFDRLLARRPDATQDISEWFLCDNKVLQFG